MTERFKKAYDSLVKAFFEGTLAKHSCSGCACGNIIAGALGIPISKKDILTASVSDDDRVVMKKLLRIADEWTHKRYRIFGTENYQAFPEFYSEINVAGYTANEFVMIENAFERNTNIHYGYYYKCSEEEILKDQYNGLCAVVDVLIELDEGKEDASELKAKFREHPKLQVMNG